MNNNFRLFPIGAEARFDEIHFGLNDRKIILRPALKNKARTESSEIWDTGDVKKDILWKNIGESRQNFLRTPSLALEVDDVGLHEDCASVAEGWHGFGREGDIRKLLNLHSEAFGCRLQKVSVSGRALRVQLEVF